MLGCLPERSSPLTHAVDRMDSPGGGSVKVVVEVDLKPGVLDPEAVTIERSLHHLGFDGISGIRKTRVFTFEVASSDRAEVEAKARSACDKLLANPVIETYRIAIEP